MCSALDSQLLAKARDVNIQICGPSTYTTYAELLCRRQHSWRVSKIHQLRLSTTRCKSSGQSQPVGGLVWKFRERRSGKHQCCSIMIYSSIPIKHSMMLMGLPFVEEIRKIGSGFVVKSDNRWSSYWNQWSCCYCIALENMFHLWWVGQERIQII